MADFKEISPNASAGAKPAEAAAPAADAKPAEAAAPAAGNSAENAAAAAAPAEKK